MTHFYATRLEYLKARVRIETNEMERILEHHEYALDCDPANNPVSRHYRGCERLRDKAKAEILEIEMDTLDALLSKTVEKEEEYEFLL